MIRISNLNNTLVDIWVVFCIEECNTVIVQDPGNPAKTEKSLELRGQLMDIRVQGSFLSPLWRV